MTALLAIETATDHASVALVVGEQLWLREGGEPQRHTEQVAPAVVELLAEAGITAADLDAVAVDHGPGLFTGLRVGLATAVSLAAVLDLPVVTARSTDLVAQAACELGLRGTLAVAVDARRGEVFAATYELSGVATESSPIRCLEPEAFAALAAGCDLIAGDGAQRYADRLRGREVLGDPLRPSAAVLARVGVDLLAAGATQAATEVQALYLREPDAVANFAVRGQR